MTKMRGAESAVMKSIRLWCNVIFLLC